MKQILTYFAAILLISSCGSTQEGLTNAEYEEAKLSREERLGKPEVLGSPNGGMKRRTKKIDVDMLISRLDMTEEQEEQFVFVWADADRQFVEILRMHKGERIGMRDKLKALTANRDAKLAEFLSEDQMTKLKGIIKSHRGNRGKRGNRGAEN